MQGCIKQTNEKCGGVIGLSFHTCTQAGTKAHLNSGADETNEPCKVWERVSMFRGGWTRVNQHMSSMWKKKTNLEEEEEFPRVKGWRTSRVFGSCCSNGSRRSAVWPQSFGLTLTPSGSVKCLRFSVLITQKEQWVYLEVTVLMSSGSLDSTEMMYSTKAQGGRAFLQDPPSLVSQKLPGRLDALCPWPKSQHGH